MTPASLPYRRARAAVPALALVAVLAACGGSDAGGHSSGHGTTAAGSPSGSSSGTSAAADPHAGHDMAAAPSYPPITPGPAAPGAHNAADVAFAAGMVPHHGQAVVMADLLLDRSENTQVRALAATITAAQTPEIATMAGWLKGWGETVPDPYAMPGEGHEGHAMTGMISAEQLEDLTAAMGPDADRAFLTLMIAHHEGAVSMAKAQLAGGENEAATSLAHDVVAAQTAEIATMRRLLTTLG